MRSSVVETRWAHDPKSAVRPGPPQLFKKEYYYVYMRLAYYPLIENGLSRKVRTASKSLHCVGVFEETLFK